MFLTPRQVAARLGLCYETVLRLIKRDAIPASVIPTLHIYMVPVSWIEAVEAGAIDTWQQRLAADTGQGAKIAGEPDA